MLALVMELYHSNREVIQLPMSAAFPLHLRLHSGPADPLQVKTQPAFASPQGLNSMSSLANSSLYSTFYLSPKVGPFNSKEFTYLSKNKHSPPHTRTQW